VSALFASERKQGYFQNAERERNDFSKIAVLQRKCEITKVILLEEQNSMLKRERGKNCF